MSLRTDLMYPFGNQFMDKFDTSTMTALRNMINLSKERIWLSEGQPITDESMNFDSMLTSDQIECAKRSVSVINGLMDDINQAIHDRDGA